MTVLLPTNQRGHLQQGVQGNCREGEGVWEGECSPCMTLVLKPGSQPRGGRPSNIREEAKTKRTVGRNMVVVCACVCMCVFVCKVCGGAAGILERKNNIKHNHLFVCVCVCVLFCLPMSVRVSCSNCKLICKSTDPPT